MAADRIDATRIIDAPLQAVFALLADPGSHAAIDGTGRVRDALDRAPITAVGQIFRVAMFHENHPDGDYRMANRVEVFDPPRAIAWKPGYYESDGSLGFGGWTWRYDLVPAGPGTRVTLTYDWSAVSDAVRSYLAFPPFPAGHLDESLAHLAELLS